MSKNLGDEPTCGQDGFGALGGRLNETSGWKGKVNKALSGRKSSLSFVRLSRPRFMSNKFRSSYWKDFKVFERQDSKLLMKGKSC
jgi:hypothetical protein